MVWIFSISRSYEQWHGQWLFLMTYPLRQNSHMAFAKIIIFSTLELFLFDKKERYHGERIIIFLSTCNYENLFSNGWRCLSLWMRLEWYRQMINYHLKSCSVKIEQRNTEEMNMTTTDVILSLIDEEIYDCNQNFNHLASRLKRFSP